MSVQTVSRIAALLALDANKLRDFLPNQDGSDDNEENRARLVTYYGDQLDGGSEDAGDGAQVSEKDLVLDGDMNAIFRYLADNLPRPAGGEAPAGGG